MQKEIDIKDIFTVAGRLKRMRKEFIGSEAFKVDFKTLMDLIDNLKQQNEF